MKSKITSDILQWAEQRGILSSATPQSQFLKLIEEVGELSQGIQKNNKEEIKDAIGDCIVVLTILSALCDINVDDCITHAYSQIKNRKGVMVNGVFKKDTNDSTVH
jgi:NTP pyrophosphatase (non-canonical NTP hydrolase)